MAHRPRLHHNRGNHHQHDSLRNGRISAGKRGEAGPIAQSPVRRERERGRTIGKLLRGLSQEPQASF